MKLLKLIAVIGFISVSALFAQTSSTYSRSGLGDLMYSYSGKAMGMGQGGVAVTDRDFVNILNPASWTKLRLTRMEFGFDYIGVNIADNNKSSFYSAGNFSGFTIAFPVSTTYGVGVVAGMVPYSYTDYKVKNQGNTSDISGKYSILYEGSGGLSKVFVGSSAKLLKDLSIGATFEYYFGNINYSSEVTFDNGVTTSYHEKEVKPRGLGTTLGLITPDFSYLIGSSKIKDLRFGFSANLISSLKTDTLMLAHSSNTYDTLNYGDADMKIPVRLNFGLSCLYADNYQLFVDYTMQSWKEYSFNNIKDANLQNLNRIVAGFEYKPPRELGSSAFGQMMWRAALGFEQTQYKLNGKGINYMFVSGGFSYPLSLENTLDVGIQYGQRGTKDSGLMKENFIKLTAGVSLGELWFFRTEK